ncbi:MAG: GH3 auxin-responsive promoter family protein, partial [Oscillospiraceae bacterium]
YRSNVIASLILCTSSKRGRFTVRPGDKTLYGFAPLPYATGLFPLLLEEEISLKYLPSLKDGKAMSFGQRNKEGFKLGLNSGIDLFFGMSSVVSYITESFAESGAAKSPKRPPKTAGNGQKANVIHMTMSMLRRYLTSKYQSNRDGVPMKPKDLFHLKGFVCAGTDTACYKDYLEDTWGVRPMEIAAGTEPTIIGTETWSRDGLVLFPDACFYEFIPEPEMLKNLDDPSYQPRTVLLNELEANRSYELVISVLKGGAFARYRVGDMYRCVSTGCEKRDDGVRLPRVTFVDRVPTIIDIAGFTRITEPMIAEVIALSGLPVADWLAAKQFNADRRPYLQLYIEMEKEALESVAVSRQLLIEHLSVYFKCFDSDYNDLKRLLGIDPLQVTILRSGTMAAYRRAGHEIRRINPPALALSELLAMQTKVPNFPAFVAQGGVSRE